MPEKNQNPLISRMKAIHAILKSAYDAGVGMAPYTKGFERELFIRAYLSQVLPASVRFGCGEILGKCVVGSKYPYGGNNIPDEIRRSGQCDIVMESAFSASIPVLSFSDTRLYLAETVAAVIEVKSRLNGKEWEKIERRAHELASFKRAPPKQSMNGTEKIPFFVVGYDGWKTKATIQERRNNLPIDGVLLINNEIFEGFGEMRCYSSNGVGSLWGFTCALYQAVTAISIHFGEDLLGYWPNGSEIA